VITGASSGLGESTARLLASKGAIVVLGARRKDRINALAEDLTARGGRALGRRGRRNKPQRCGSAGEGCNRRI
jgi:NADP-dependent 3-hydroxy acid dehydrogenase YdfG